MKSELPIALLIGTASKILADEAKDYLTWFSKKLIHWSAKRFPIDFQDRIEEEWLAHSNDLPGNLAKIWHGLGCFTTALKVTDILSKVFLLLIFNPLIEIAVAMAFVIFLLGWLLGVPQDSRPERMRTERLRRAAGGLVVLGLNKLEKIPIDYQPRQEALREKEFTETLMGPTFSYAIDKVGERYRKIVKQLRS